MILLPFPMSGLSTIVNVAGVSVVEADDDDDVDDAFVAAAFFFRLARYSCCDSAMTRARMLSS